MRTVQPFKVLSLGAGVQSTVMLLMALGDEMERPDVAIFADTMREPESVYEHLRWLTEVCAAHDFPLHTISYGDLAEYALDTTKRSGTIPVYLANDDGSTGHLRRDCTADFKVAVIKRKAKELAEGRRVEMWMGISLDEVTRMRDSGAKWLTNRYPLVEQRMSRHDCQRWLAAHDVAAPRSACYFCPFHSNEEWRRLRDHEPIEFAKAVTFEQELQAAHAGDGPKKFRGVPYLHRSLIPLSQVDLSTPEDHGQGSLFDSECLGVCGV